MTFCAHLRQRLHRAAGIDLWTCVDCRETAIGLSLPITLEASA